MELVVSKCGFIFSYRLYAFLLSFFVFFWGVKNSFCIELLQFFCYLRPPDVSGDFNKVNSWY